MNIKKHATSDANAHRQSADYHVGIILIPQFNMCSLISAVEPMRIANFMLQESHYVWEYIHCDDADTDRHLTASNDMQIDCKPLDDSKKYNLLLVFGSDERDHQTPQKLHGFLRKFSRQGTLICAFESGVHTLARAGLLTDKTCTTHWSYLAGLQEEFSNINVTEQLFSIDENIASCAGGVAGIDFILHLIEQRHGTQLISEINDQLMWVGKRPDISPQRHMLSTTSTLHPDIKKVIELIQNNITAPPNIPKIAKFIGISQRQLERRCKEQMGYSLIQLSQILRLEHARALLVSTRLSILNISVASGFNSVSHFSQSFRRYYQKKPSEYRKAWAECQAQPLRDPLWANPLWADKSAGKSAKAKYEFPQKTPSTTPSMLMSPYRKSSYKKPLNIKPIGAKNTPLQKD